VKWEDLEELEKPVCQDEKVTVEQPEKWEK